MTKVRVVVNVALINGTVALLTGEVSRLGRGSRFLPVRLPVEVVDRYRSARREKETAATALLKALDGPERERLECRALDRTSRGRRS